MLRQIPAAKAFKDAISSLSPAQQRFAKQFRGMQLDGSVFAVVVLPLRPQLEVLLGLPPNALTKEIQLTQDLLTLFIEHQIPSDLLTASEEVGQGPEVSKLECVKTHVAGLMAMIAKAKQEELDEAFRATITAGVVARLVVGHDDGDLTVTRLACCPAGHKLELTTHQDGGYATGWVCDKCSCKGAPDTERWVCLQCTYDVCVQCVDSHAVGRVVGNVNPFGVRLRWADGSESDEVPITALSQPSEADARAFEEREKAARLAAEQAEKEAEERRRAERGHSRSQRKIEREIHKLQMEEKKVLAEIKKLASQGQKVRLHTGAGSRQRRDKPMA